MRHFFLAALALLAVPSAAAQDTITTSTAPGPTQVHLPLVRAVTDGSRIVLQVVGTTDMSASSSINQYIGPNGYVTAISDGQDIRGPAGSTETSNPVPGPMGTPGKSAYQSWVDQGNSGTEADFIASLKGAQGITGGAGSAGNDGISAYQQWVAAGNTGTSDQFLASLVGPTGTNGAAGSNGSSAELRVQGAYLQWRAGSGAWANLIALADITGPAGPAGSDGGAGPKGDTGSTPTLSIGTVSTLMPGAQASANFTGTSAAPVLNLGIPSGQTGGAGSQGTKGDTGSTGQAGSSGVSPVLSIGTVSTLSAGAQATASLAGTSANPVLNLGIPTGLTGSSGSNGAAGSNGTNGATGATGATPALSIGTVTTLAAGSSATAALSGTAAAPVLSLGLPVGAVGATGSTGATGATGTAGSAATVTVGTVTALSGASSPTVTNSGTTAAAVLNFGIPKGEYFLTDATLAQTAVVAIGLGPRSLTVSTNCLVGDRLVMVPSAAMPAGYQLGDMFCSANGTALATLYAPLLAIGASYSIVVKVIAFR